MPLEISEIGIHIAVGQPAGGGQQPAAQPQQGGGSGAGNQEEVVKQCVEEVLNTLKQREER